MTKKERIADLKKRIEEWDRSRLGMEGLRRLKFQLADLDRNFPLNDKIKMEGWESFRRELSLTPISPPLTDKIREE